MPFTTLYNFEGGTVHPWLAWGYEFNDPNNSLNISTEQAHGGNASMKVTNLKPLTEGRLRTPEIFYGEPDVIPLTGASGSEYGWGCWAYSEDPLVEGWGIEWVFWQDINTTVGGRSVSWAPNIPGSWIEMRVLPEIMPANSNWLVIKPVAYFTGEAPIGTAFYLDDFTYETVAPPASIGGKSVRKRQRDR